MTDLAHDYLDLDSLLTPDEIHTLILGRASPAFPPSARCPRHDRGPRSARGPRHARGRVMTGSRVQPGSRVMTGPRHGRPDACYRSSLASRPSSPASSP